MSITFLAIAASLLTAGNPQPAKPSTSAVPISTSQVQQLAGSSCTGVAWCGVMAACQESGVGAASGWT